MGVRNRDRPVIRRLDSKTFAACFGLALAGQIVSLHQGSVSAGSAAIGRGSAFVARLPRTTSTEKRDGTLCAYEVRHEQSAVIY